MIAMRRTTIANSPPATDDGMTGCCDRRGFAGSFTSSSTRGPDIRHLIILLLDLMSRRGSGLLGLLLVPAVQLQPPPVAPEPFIQMEALSQQRRGPREQQEAHHGERHNRHKSLDGNHRS